MGAFFRPVIGAGIFLVLIGWLAPMTRGGARRAVSDSRMPCHDIAVALSRAPTSPIAAIGQAAVNNPVRTMLPAMPKARPAITRRGARWKLPSQPHRTRHGTATATMRENRKPAAARS